MIDAGSSGSRVHVYRFNYCKAEPELEDEIFHMLQPGLSSFGDPVRAAESLDELMHIAVESVPETYHHCTPIAVKATAGLRLLGKDKSDQILAEVHTRLQTRYPFPIADVEIMDGKDEGVYAWITVNYLLGRLRKTIYGRSAAIFDLGGASTQIVFEPRLPKDHDSRQEMRLDFGGNQYTLYQHSYLGYGLNEARRRIKTEVIETYPGGAKTVYHPCLPDNHTETIKWTHDNITRSIDLVGTGAGHAECRAIVERVFNKDKPCPVSPCAFDGVYQPSLTDTFKDRELYAFSFFYDLSQPLGMPLEFSVAELGTLASNVCGGNTRPFRHVPGALQRLHTQSDYCLDLTYAHALLRVGYELPPERLVRTAKKIRDAETGWCLGASIAMLDKAQTCHV
ncbi:Guanosine-diphosphatase [Apophysomyces sp. BC1034]|nr:Guanosine-diphosphatase [Apophysomyces sp. BC1015]KAG0175953.1 Guanosine-diphosphatase [Apophysomyces sp. BC1021]KAG0185946.1 Guanosine-diphosphatase [Apophysomyces sp. BC1034]